MDDLSGTSRPFQYSIPDDSKDSPLASDPLHYATSPDTVDPIKEGIGLGAKAAGVSAGLYAIAVTLIISATEFNRFPTGDLRDFGVVVEAILNAYMGAVMVAGLALVIGGVPAVIIGVIGGGLIGWTFRFIKRRLSTIRALHYGFWVSLVLLVVRIGLLAGTFDDGLDDQLIWLIWFAPNLIAFFGFWWVTVKINEKLPNPSP